MIKNYQPTLILGKACSIRNTVWLHRNQTLNPRREPMNINPYTVLLNGGGIVLVLTLAVCSVQAYFLLKKDSPSDQDLRFTRWGMITGGLVTAILSGGPAVVVLLAIKSGPSGTLEILSGQQALQQYVDVYSLAMGALVMLIIVGFLTVGMIVTGILLGSRRFHDWLERSVSNGVLA
jgi:hypothetical protein